MTINPKTPKTPPKSVPANAPLADKVASALTTNHDRVADLKIEVARYKTWVNDLQSGLYINCVYCGHRYGPQNKVPTTLQDAAVVDQAIIDRVVRLDTASSIALGDWAKILAQSFLDRHPTEAEVLAANAALIDAAKHADRGDNNRLMREKYLPVWCRFFASRITANQTPMAEVLKAHIRQCPKHPMARLGKALSRLVEAKRIKDVAGKTPRYKTLKEGAWEAAETALKEAGLS